MKSIGLQKCKTLVAALAVTGSGLLAGCNAPANADAAKFADVTAVKPVTETVTTPREVCADVTVTHQQDPKDKHEVLGTALGAVVGGVVGHQVGGGDGRKLATVAGAVAGGYAGKRIQERREKPVVTTTTERRCHTENDASQKVVGYDVTYVYNGVTGHTRMHDKPGAKLPVREGVTVVGAGG